MPSIVSGITLLLEKVDAFQAAFDRQIDITNYNTSNAPGSYHKNGSISPLNRESLVAGLTLIPSISILTLFTMRIRYGQSFTIRGLFSRRSKRGRKSKRCSTIRDDNGSSASASTSASTIRPPRLQSMQLSKELEILGLLTDPRAGQEASSASWLSSSPASTLHVAASPSPAPSYSLFPAAHNQPAPDPFRNEYEYDDYDDDDAYYSEQEQPFFSRQTHQTSYPTSPLLPPPPSLSLQVRSPAREHVSLSVPEPEPEADIPLSPTLSYRTFVTRSSGIFPWGTEPHVVEEDAASEILVLPTPPQFARSYGCEYQNRKRVF
ncbi:hypothetical protein BDW72DRAFT_189546 [Aspergillus terricola var. indicus]